jgi:E3 ubiquitin ligase SMURF1/2
MASMENSSTPQPTLPPRSNRHSHPSSIISPPTSSSDSSESSAIPASRTKIRLTILCAKNLVKRDFFSHPDPFCKVQVDGTTQSFLTDVCKDTQNPKWNTHFDLFFAPNDTLTVSVYNHKKVQKKPEAAFLGCVKIRFSCILRLKDTGYQRLDLNKLDVECIEPIKGQIVISLLSRDSTRSNGSIIQHVVIADTDENSSNSANSTAAVPRSASSGNLLAPNSPLSTSNHLNSANAVQPSPDDEDPLPPGWEKRVTPGGLPYYVNHNAKMTQWERPELPNTSRTATETSSGPTSEPVPLTTRNHQRSSTRHRQYMSRNTLHQAVANATSDGPPPLPPPPVHLSRNNLSIDSTTSVSSVGNQLGSQTNLAPHRRMNSTGSELNANASFTSPNTSTVSLGATPQSPPSEPLPPPTASTNGVNHSRSSSSVTNVGGGGVGSSTSTIGLPEGYQMRIAPKGQVYFFHVPSRYSTWYDPRVPRELIEERLNLAELVGPLEAGWEIRTTTGGRQYYVDHNNRTTQFTDPRLVANHSLIRNILRSRQAEQNNNLINGTPTVATPSAAVTIPTVKSLPHKSDGEFTNLRKEQRKNLVQKMTALRLELSLMQPHSGHCRLEVSRKDIFEESYRVVMKLRPKDLRKRLMIKFKGEEGLDYGGIAREWLYLLSHEMLNPYYGLFQYTREDVYTLQINPDSAINPDHLSYFHFVGRIIGIAIFHGHYIDGGFTLPFYKMLLNKQINLDDIQLVDAELHRSLCWMLTNDIQEVIDTTFSVEHDSFGQLVIHELKPNGRDVQVTEQNKKEYVRLYVNYRFKRGIEQQFQALQKGFHELVPQHLLSSFDEKELELVISGLGKIDLNDWKVNTRLKHCTTDHNVVKWFWQAIEAYSEEQRARLLQFVTGSSRVPLQGFKALQGSTGSAGPRLFTVHLIDASTDNLPKAHTCFNRIDLPNYERYEKLYEKLTQAIEETCGFAIE